MSRPDPHSFFDDSQPRTRALNLNWNVDFERKVIDGEVTFDLDRVTGGPMDLDTRGLKIEKVADHRGESIRFRFTEEDSILGLALRVDLPVGTKQFKIRYRTSPEAVALQWLSPSQTAGKKSPYLFSQCQPIHARTLVPCQDSAVVRVPYRAEVTVPEALTAVMSAAFVGVRPGEKTSTRTFLFEMPQPIPSYLLAFAVGAIESRDVGPRSRVWAESKSVEAAAWEFGEVEKQLQKAEELFGPYEWDRYDMLVLPPSFPYGGMENPRLTFLTPTLLAGDRSLVDVVAHELAHSWTGNLVTSATMEHFWLNEGFTVYAERRILEALQGSERAALEWSIGQRGLDEELTRFGANSPFTRLRGELSGVNPDEVYSRIPYEKGARFLVALERAVGRERFDPFLREYMKRFHFTSITTEDFLQFLKERLPDAVEKVDIQPWLYGSGMPDHAPTFHSKKLEELMNLAKGWSKGTRPSAEQIRDFGPKELLIFMQNLPEEVSQDDCRWLDATFKLTSQGNYEILTEWLVLSIRSNYEPAFDRVKRMVKEVGRMKYLRSLYTALSKNERTRLLARELFEENEKNYHPISQRLVHSILTASPPSR